MEENKEELTEELREELKEELRKELREELRKEAWEELRKETGEELREEAREEFRKETGEEFIEGTREEPREETGEEPGEEAGEGVRKKTKEEIRKDEYKIAVGMVSDIGARKTQQDAAIVSNDQNRKKTLAVLCDGMGGMQGGERASNICSEMIYNDFCDMEEKKGIDDYNSFLRNELIKADEEVASLRDSTGREIRSGTTAVAVVIDKDNMFWASAGDSRLYIIRDNTIFQITKDHNYMMELMKLVRLNRISINEAINNPKKEALVSFVGMGGLRYIDANKHVFKLLPGDILVICSDGLYKALKNESIMEIVSACQDDMQNAAGYLVDEAIAVGGKHQDNTTVIAMKYIK